MRLLTPTDDPAQGRMNEMRELLGQWTFLDAERQFNLYLYYPSPSTFARPSPLTVSIHAPLRSWGRNGKVTIFLCQISVIFPVWNNQANQTKQNIDVSGAEWCSGGRCRLWSPDHGKNPAQQTNGNGKNYQFICYHETGSLTISNQMNWNEFGKIDLNCLIKQAQDWKPLDV